MPKAGDELIVTFNSQAPLAWGTFRNSSTRESRSGERYIPIPKNEAKRLKIYNSNYGTGLGINIFNATSADGIFKGKLKASGSSKQGDIYAKQFQGYNDLCALEPWLTRNHAKIGDQIRFKWTSDTDIEMTFISQQD